MCRSIKTLLNFDPPATETEVRAAALQYVRKLSGFQKPSLTNELAFNQAIESIAQITNGLLDSLVSQAEPRNREVEAAKAHARAIKRFGSQ